MTDNMVVIRTIDRDVTEHGWGRLPEMDTKGSAAWKAPDGKIYAYPHGVMPELRTIVWTNCPTRWMP